MKILIAGIFLLTGFNAAAQMGWWGAKLHRADGNAIAFTFEWKTENGKAVWYIHNAAERIKVDNIKELEDSVIIQMPVFESQFRIKKTGKQLNGVWIKGGSVKSQVLPFSAAQGNQRFVTGAAPGKNISGSWAVSFANSKPDEISVGIFKQAGSKVTGTFLNATGDYRYLEGIVKNDSMFLSGFDGGHAFLFTAKINGSNTITGGSFFSGAVYKEGWTAVKDAHAKVPAESVAMFVKPGEESLDFSFKDLDGKQVAINSERFKNKVVIIQLMGSWCPNCMDETAFLSDYYNANKQRGVEVVALAYEYTTDWERSVSSLRKFQQRFNVQYTILNTGVTVTDSLRTEKTLPQVTPIKFFPSSIIIDKKNKIRKLDTGFNGPATGSYYTAYKKEFYETVDKLLKEN
jgi:peroxiredoxin